MNVLDKDDSPPVYRDEPIIFTVSEDLSPGHTVGTIRATDPDTIGSLSYALIGGDDRKFTLNKNSGILKLIDTLDREMKDMYKLSVRVSDGVQSTDTIVSIQVSWKNYFTFFLFAITKPQKHSIFPFTFCFWFNWFWNRFNLNLSKFEMFNENVKWNMPAY